MNLPAQREDGRPAEEAKRVIPPRGNGKNVESNGRSGAPGKIKDVSVSLDSGPSHFQPLCALCPASLRGGSLSPSRDFEREKCGFRAKWRAAFRIPCMAACSHGGGEREKKKEAARHSSSVGFLTSSLQLRGPLCSPPATAKNAVDMFYCPAGTPLSSSGAFSAFLGTHTRTQ